MNPRSDAKIRIDRRTLLIGGGVGAGLLLAWRFWPRQQSLNLAVREGETALGAYLKIGADNRVTVAVPQTEMGQGIWTALPQIVADALGADWKMIGVEPAPVGPAYANHLAGGTGAAGIAVLGGARRPDHRILAGRGGVIAGDSRIQFDTGFP